MHNHRPWNDELGQIEVNEKQSAFIDWLLDPTRKGSQADFAREIGVERTTLTHWKKDKAFQRVWEERAAKLNISTERIQSVVDALWKNALNGDTQSAKLYLEYVNKFTPTQRVVVQDRSVAELSDAELLEAVEDNVRQLRAAE